jgi:N-acetyl-gamma-glutamyl-phosphate reductase
MPDQRDISCAIVGASGYSGAELIALLAGHPRARIAGLFGSEKREAGDAAQPISGLFPRLRGVCDLPVNPASPAAILALKPAAVFLATPHAASHDLAPALAEAGVVVLDLSAAFRLKDAAVFARHYAIEHAHGDWLARAVYGLPELFRDSIARAMLIAVPGCYPTSAILPLAPLVRAGALAPGHIPIIDSTSGVSGAGRHALLHTSFCEVSLQPYGVFKHRHQPEIDAYTGTRTIFTPHLGAYERGILSTIHLDLAPDWNAAKVADTLAQAYAGEPFVRLLPAGVWPSIAAVRHTNFCDIGWAVDEQARHLILVSAIDNLVKGAAGQGVQCFNTRFGIPETTGLLRRGAASA